MVHKGKNHFFWGGSVLPLAYSFFLKYLGLWTSKFIASFFPQKAQMF